MLLKNGSVQADPRTGRATLSLVITSAVILTTLLVGYTITNPPRSWMTWTILVFVCFVEFAIGMVAAEASGVDSPRQMSSAMASVVVGSAGALGFAGFTTILISLVFTKPTAHRDAVVVSLLVIETVLFLIGMVLLRHSDRAIRADEKGSVESNRMLINKASQIHEFVRTLRSVKPASVDQSIQIEALVKGLESCESQFNHSHHADPEMENGLSFAISELDAVASTVAQNGLNQMALERLSKIQKDLESFAGRLAAP